jgi:hypothetical protein
LPSDALSAALEHSSSPHSTPAVPLPVSGGAGDLSVPTTRLRDRSKQGRKRKVVAVVATVEAPRSAARSRGWVVPASTPEGLVAADVGSAGVGSERVYSGSESYVDGPSDVLAARYMVSSGNFLMLTKDELVSWFSGNGHHLMVDQTLAVGKVLVQLRDIASAMVNSPAARSVVPTPPPVLDASGKSVIDDAFSFICFDDYQHRTTSRSTAVLFTLARDYNLDIAYWRLLRFNDRTDAVTLVSTHTNAHALSAGSLRAWLNYYRPLPPETRQRFFSGASAGLILLGDLGFLVKLEEFASLMSLNWGVRPLTGSKPVLSARNFLSSNGGVSERKSAFDDAVRSCSLRTVDPFN